MNGNTEAVLLFLAFFLLLFPALQLVLCRLFARRAGKDAEAGTIRRVCLRQAMLDIVLSGGALLIFFPLDRARGLLWGLLAVLLFVQLGGIMRTLKQCQEEKAVQSRVHQLLALVLTMLHTVLIFWAAGVRF